MIKQLFARTLYDYIPCKGGWDLDTPSLALANGFVRDAINFEVSQVVGGGYRRVDGYERVDGRLAPSAASFTIIQISGVLVAPGPYSTAILIADVTSGASGWAVWAGANYWVLTNTSGIFSPGDTLNDVFGGFAGTVTTQTVIPSQKDLAQYQNAASDYYRSLITVVPGSGPIRGVAVLTVAGTDTLFAWRDNVGATAEAIYKATAGGWTLVPFYNEVSFTAGTGPPVEGNTLTQGAVTATIKRVVQETGSWLNGTAAGRLIVTNPSGGNFAAGAATAPGATLTLSGIQTAITVAPGGTYEIIPHNFSGQSTTRRLYGCSGVAKPFEFDGDVYVPINIGTSVFPSIVTVHREHLMFGVGSSLIHSGPGTPYKFNAAAGAAEIALGDVLTNFLPQPGDTQSAALTITTNSNVHTLYGTSALNWSQVGQNNGVMGVARTSGRLNQSYWLDNNGVTNLQTSQNFGNFSSSTLTNTVSSFIRSKLGIVVGSIVQRDKSQYRLYFSDSTALYATLVNGRLFGLMPCQVTHSFTCFWDGPSNVNKYYAGGSNGYVYQLDVGTSFDGDAIEAFMTFNWNPIKGPRVLKRYRKASLEIQGGSYAEITFGYNLSYQRSNVPQDTGRTYPLTSSGNAFWDSITWDNFYWDGGAVTPTEVELRGSGENIQVVIRSETDYIPSFSVNSILLHYSQRRGLR